MDNFIFHYGVGILLCAIGLFFVIMTYGAHFTGRSGVPFVGGLFIAIGFLTMPVKWPALLGLMDPGYWSIPYFLVLDHIRDKKFAAVYSEQDYEEKTVDNTKALRIWILERNEEVIRPYSTRHIYELRIPKLLFAVCKDKTGKCFILVDKCIKGGQIEILGFDEEHILISGLKSDHDDFTVEIEIIMNNKTSD